MRIFSDGKMRPVDARVEAVTFFHRAPQQGERARRARCVQQNSFQRTAAVQLSTPVSRLRQL